MKRNCDFFRNYLSDHLFQENDNGLMEHITSCKSCADYYMQYMRIMDQLRQETESSSNLFLRAKILDKLQNDRQNERVTSGSAIPVFRYALMSIAAVILITVGIMLGTLHSGNMKINSFTTDQEKYSYYSELFYLDEFHLENIETLLLENNEN